MEIKKNDCIYAINPRRVIAIESYKTERFYDRHIHWNPLSENETDEDGNQKCYDWHLIIHMTDNFQIEITYEEDYSEYERMRDELASIVGG